MPFDEESAFRTSGIRLGTPAMTTRGFKEAEFEQVARWIVDALKNSGEENLQKIKSEVKSLLKKYPIYETLDYEN